jgi:ubiquitin related modifier 1
MGVIKDCLTTFQLEITNMLKNYKIDFNPKKVKLKIFNSMITIEFSGGMETLFNNHKQIHLTIPNPTLTLLLKTLALQCSNPSLLHTSGKIKPGVLCLINDVDSELLGEELHDGDVVVLISTLHGG